MTSENPKHEIALAWKPRAFQGNDLLPVAAGPQQEEREAPVSHQNFDPSTDFVVPQLKLLQGMADEVTQGHPGAQPGKFLLTMTGEILEPPLRVLVVFHGRSRALFPNDKRPDMAGLERCLSRDGVTGDVYGDCAACKYKDWPPKVAGRKNVGPSCSEAHNFIVALPSGLASVRFSRTSFAAARRYVSQVVMAGQDFWAHPTIIRVRAQQEEVNGKKVTYYIMDPTWEVPETVPIGYRQTARENFDKVNEAADAGRLRAGEDEPDAE